ncbi:hypothetical protein [Paenibacillus sp. 843]
MTRLPTGLLSHLLDMFALRPHVDLRPHPTLLLPAAKKARHLFI